VEGGYRISKTIRDMCIFAQHNILNDPPFSQIDLICCRNPFLFTLNRNYSTACWRSSITRFRPTGIW
jgi:chemotaxis methyl-accepting protein methylase